MSMSLFTFGFLFNQTHMRFIGIFACLYSISFSSICQNIELVNDDFTDSTKYIDLTKKLIWGNNSGIRSAFRLVNKQDQSGLTYKAITQSDSARKHSGYQLPNSLKASLVYDYRFQDFDRNNDSLTIEFDVLWDVLVSGGNQGRIVVALMHDYPDSIQDNTITDSVNAEAPFGRPAYSFRILNRIPQGANNYANMMYGGGKDSLGEFEKFSSGPNRWWLPGFISGPGGIAPESSAPEYPLSGVVRWLNYTTASVTRWKHYTWKINPERLEVKVRTSGLPAGQDTLLMFMVVPKPGPENEMLAKMQTGHSLNQPLDSLPILYNWFEKVNGVRFIMAGKNPTYFANISVKGSSGGLVSNKGKLEHQIVKLFPNPAKDKIHVSVKDSETGSQYEIVNSKGQTLMNGNIDRNSNEIKLSGLHQGLYLIRVVENSGRIRQQKFLIE